MSTSGNRVLAAVLGGVLLVAAVPALDATAEDTVVGIGVARGGYDRASFSVPAWTDAAGASVATVTAHLHAGDAAVDATLVPDDRAGFFTVAHPLELTDDGGTMPRLGRYGIDVTVTDSAGNTRTRVDAGTLDFTLTPQFVANDGAAGGLTFVPSTLDREHRSTRAGGTLLGVRPGSGVRVPVAGRSVTVAFSGGGQSVDRTATTASDGTFVTDDVEDAAGSFTASVAGDDDELHGTARAFGYPAVRTTTVRVVATADQHRYLPGSTITISGDVRAGSGTVAGVRLAVTTDSAPSPVTVTSDARGHFVGRLTAIAGYYPRWSVSTDDRYATGETVGGDLVIPSEASYVGTSISLSAAGVVSARSALVRTYNRVDAIYGRQPTVLQYSVDGRSRWTNLATKTPGPYDALTLSAPGRIAVYYRLYHPTTDELAATASTPVFLARHVTRVVGNNAGPEPVRKGRTLTVTGALQQYASGWKAMPRTRVELYFLPVGARTYGYVAAGTTDAHGRAKVTARATRDGRWLLVYFGDATHFNSTATADYVDVR